MTEALGHRNSFKPVPMRVGSTAASGPSDDRYPSRPTRGSRNLKARGRKMRRRARAVTIDTKTPEMI
jgi:hypothetical protein